MPAKWVKYVGRKTSFYVEESCQGFDRDKLVSAGTLRQGDKLGRRGPQSFAIAELFRRNSTIFKFNHAPILLLGGYPYFANTSVHSHAEFAEAASRAGKAEVQEMSRGYLGPVAFQLSPSKLISTDEVAEVIEDICLALMVSVQELDISLFEMFANSAETKDNAVGIRVNVCAAPALA
ncbi:hypothetical protein KM043_010919 [Ampulex compressa]|nr:hypothetical protein KM043_010919 [Ampulex compressa]